jgi:hypothetical protein
MPEAAHLCAKYFSRGRGSRGYPPAGFQPHMGDPRFQEVMDDGTGEAPYLVQPSHPVHYSAQGGHPSVINPIGGSVIVDPTLAAAGGTPYPSPSARGRSLQRSMSPHGLQRSSSRHRSPYHGGSRSRSRHRYDDQYGDLKGVGYYEVGDGDILLEIDNDADIQVGRGLCA